MLGRRVLAFLGWDDAGFPLHWRTPTRLDLRGFLLQVKRLSATQNRPFCPLIGGG